MCQPVSATDVGEHSSPSSQSSLVQHSCSTSSSFALGRMHMGTFETWPSTARTSPYAQVSPAAQSASRPQGMAHTFEAVQKPLRHVLGTNGEQRAPPDSVPFGAAHSHVRASFNAGESAQALLSQAPSSL
jgi:hypothetical protein